MLMDGFALAGQNCNVKSLFTNVFYVQLNKMYKLNVVLNIIKKKKFNTQLKYNMDPINTMAVCLVIINSQINF